mgnify:FL=1|tara:strand:- start:700 stop:1155 length:456 start_codon:yes stop_codon:yes gene_type:complete
MITIDTLKDKIENNSRLLGLDMGSKRIGISICDDRRRIATPYKTIEFTNIDDLSLELSNIIKENNIFGIIIGNPINMDGSFGKIAQSTQDRAKLIGKKINIPICLWDERLSTSAAYNLSSNLDIKFSQKKKKIDEKAATFILQGAIDYLNN